MKIVLYGATGRAGSRILTELLGRDHEVVAVVRHPDNLAPNDGLTVVQGDLSGAEAIAEAIGGAQAVVSAMGLRRTRQTSSWASPNERLPPSSK